MFFSGDILGGHEKILDRGGVEKGKIKVILIHPVETFDKYKQKLIKLRSLDFKQSLSNVRDFDLDDFKSFRKYRLLPNFLNKEMFYLPDLELLDLNNWKIDLQKERNIVFGNYVDSGVNFIKRMDEIYAKQKKELFYTLLFQAENIVKEMLKKGICVDSIDPFFTIVDTQKISNSNLILGDLANVHIADLTKNLSSVVISNSDLQKTVLKIISYTYIWADLLFNNSEKANAMNDVYSILNFDKLTNSIK